jgi:hypothetical protein
MRVNESKSKRKRLQPYVKVGIIKQLYKDNKISEKQYIALLRKYGIKT